MGWIFLFKKNPQEQLNSLCGAGSPWLQLPVLSPPAASVAPPVSLRRDLCNAQMLQLDQSLGRRPESLMESSWIPQESSGIHLRWGGAVKERLQLRVPLGQSRSSEQLSWEGSKSPAPHCLEIFHVLTNPAYFSFSLCWAQTEAHYCLVFSIQIEFLPLYRLFMAQKFPWFLHLPSCRIKSVPVNHTKTFARSRQSQEIIAASMSITCLRAPCLWHFQIHEGGKVSKKGDNTFPKSFQKGW